jgi:hypothetical protein
MLYCNCMELEEGATIERTTRVHDDSHRRFTSSRPNPPTGRLHFSHYLSCLGALNVLSVTTIYRSHLVSGFGLFFRGR